MVGPIPEEERSAFALKLKVALTLVVAASAGLIALQGDASPQVIAVAAGSGLVVGAAVIWFVFPANGWTPRQRRRR